MDPSELLNRIAVLLWGLADSTAAAVADAVTGLPELAGETEPALVGRLLEPLAAVPDRHELLRLVRDMVGPMSDAGSPLRVHGWRRQAGAPLGLAFVLNKNGSRAVLAISPGPVVDLVVSPNAVLDHTMLNGEWDFRAAARTTQAWTATFTPGAAAVTPAGDGSVTIGKRNLNLGAAGLGMSVSRFELTVRTEVGAPTRVTVRADGFVARLLPAALAGFLGGRATTRTEPTDLVIQASRAEGVRFDEGTARITRPVHLRLPGVTTRGLTVELGVADGKFVVRPTLALTARPPGLPLTALMEGIGAGIPVLLPDRLGAGGDVSEVLPSGMGLDLALGPVSGGGAFLQRGPDAYGGIIDIDLGFFQVQAFGVLQLPREGRPLSLFVVLAGEFPYPGIQLGFGFAIDAVGGMVGINRRTDLERLRGLVAEGHADRILFPGNAVARADEVIGALDSCFPVARGRFLVGPMVRISWGGRMVSLSVAVLMELPEPVRVIILGRLLIALPDPAAPLIRLQASVFGRIDPGIPLVEFLVSLAGSWIVGVPVTGEIYVLFRGGDQAMFVLSAGGFHPKYTRPAGVPQLQRLSMNLGGGILGLRAESYLALTSNSLQFGAKLQLDATIAGCGVEGWLGLDALFVWEPVLAFSAHVYAGVAVLAFGRRLASIGLDFTLEGPAPWHAFGTGSISVLFWDVSLDFDVRWGDPAPLPPAADDIPAQLSAAVRHRKAWLVDRPATQRAGVRFTEDATRELAAGTVVPPDATLRFSQSVVPLDRAFDRFHRRAVPEQTWRVTAARFAPDDPAQLGTPVPEQFVPGEYFAMTEDEQLSRGAFESHTGGFTLSDTDVVQGAAHLVDDSYETSYQVEPGWFPAPPPARIIVRAHGWFVLETFARRIGAAERADRWRHAQLLMDSALPKVVINR